MNPFRGIIFLQTTANRKIMRFTDKVVLITGAGSGIGRATAQRFALEGGKVLVIDRNKEGGNETVDLIKKDGGTAVFCEADVGIEGDIRNSIDTALNTWNRIDVLVNNAAMMTFTRIVDLSTEDWDKVLTVNLKS